MEPPAPREEMVQMRKITLLLVVASFITISVSSDLSASSPVSGVGAASVSAKISHYIIIFVNAFDRGKVDLIPVTDDGDVPLVGGDADDLADGKADPDEEGLDAPLFDFGPDSKKLNF